MIFEKSIPEFDHGMYHRSTVESWCTIGSTTPRAKKLLYIQGFVYEYLRAPSNQIRNVDHPGAEEKAHRAKSSDHSTYVASSGTSQLTSSLRKYFFNPRAASYTSDLGWLYEKQLEMIRVKSSSKSVFVR